MLSITENGETLIITANRSVVAEDNIDFKKFEALMDTGGFKTVDFDLNHLEIVNPAFAWMLDKIQWKCVTSQASFNIIGTTDIVTIYMKIAEVMAKFAEKYIID